MDPLARPVTFRSLSLIDLLQARDLYHVHLMNKANVIGTAVGLYLIRNADTRAASGSEPHSKGPRTFENAHVRDISWPCILVLVRDWVAAHGFGGADGPYAAQDMVPKSLFMPDGRIVRVCVVQVSPAEATAAAPADIRWPNSRIGGGLPLMVETQGEKRRASVGCLVTDGHTVYALTNRHVCGRPGTPIFTETRGGLGQVGHASDLQLARLPFSEVYPGFPGQSAYATLDVGLIEVDAINDWTSQVYGLDGPVGPIVDLNEMTLGLQLIDAEVVAFGAHSGQLNGRIKALFYRYKSIGGHDYIADMLIAPEPGGTQSGPGDSGTVWHARQPASGGGKPVLRPVAVEWGGQALAFTDGTRLNFALATNLAKVCDLLDVDLMQEHNDGVVPFWGQVGHYSIATAAIASVREPSLRALLDANRERISFVPDELTAEQIRAKLARGDFIELADVPDLVWKKLATRVPGGRDVATNTGPEHPNHYADIDRPGADGRTLRDLCLADKSQISVAAWQAFYDAIGETEARSRGLLPFRVWQFFDAIVGDLASGDIAKAVCAMGVVSHYIGDACQPLHGSMLSDGYRDRAEENGKTWPGKGVHATFEDKMVDRFSQDLLAQIGPAASAGAGGQIPQIASGQDAAYALIALMDFSAKTIPPAELCDRYIELGGGTSRPVVEGLWTTFGARTATLMGAGANTLAATWEAALAASSAQLPPAAAFSEANLASIYQGAGFVPWRWCTRPVQGVVGCSSLFGSSTPMPHKHNTDRRHHIPKMSFKVQNWPAYEAGLRRRGSLTLWIENSALEHWQSCGQGGQARYTDAAIQTSLMVRTAFKLLLRQTEGLMASILTLMDLTISAPDHTTVSRRAVTLPVIQPASALHGPLHVLIDSTGLQVYGAGQWLEAKHGMKSRRTWRKLHLAVDAASRVIVAQTLTDQDVDDPSQVAPLLDQIDDPIGRVTADGVYDGAPTYQTIAAYGVGIEVVIPPRSTAVPSGDPGLPTQRDRHLAMIAEQGRLAWQVATDYGQRSLVETTMGRYKALIGPRLRARGFAAQQTEATIAVAVLNRMLAAGRPKSVRVQRVIA